MQTTIGLILAFCALIAGAVLYGLAAAKGVLWRADIKRTSADLAARTGTRQAERSAPRE